MKKRFLIIALLLLIPLAYAEITVQGPVKTLVNYGDKIAISGNILRSEDLFGIFRLELTCSENIYPMLARTVSIKADKTFKFSEELPIPPFNTGACSVKAKLEKNNQLLEEASSANFEIKSDLNGRFSIDKNKVQLGKPITITGSITKLDGTPIDGNAIVSMKQGENNVYVNTVNVQNGQLSLVYETKDSPSGEYVVDIEAMDTSGNFMSFSSAVQFSLVNEISVSAETNKQHVLPGGKVQIFGYAQTILQEKIVSGNVEIIIDNLTKFETQILRGSFEYELIVPKDVKSGKHDLKIIVEDSLGNRGFTDLSVIVDAVAEGLSISIDKQEYLPKETITLIPILLDQAGDEVKKEVSLEVYDPDNKKIYSKNVQTNEEFSILLPQFSPHGDWLIKSYSIGFNAEKNFYVVKVEELAFDIAGSNLHATNMGNVIYKNPLEITLKAAGQESIITKPLDLEVNETTIINLAEGTASGTYDVTIGGVSFEDVEIEGFTVRSYNWLYYLAIAAIALLLIYVLLNWRKWKVDNIKKARTAASKNVERIPKDPVKSYKESMIHNIKGDRPLRFKPKRTESEYYFKTDKENKPREYKKSRYLRNREREMEEKKKEEDKSKLFNMFD